MFPKSEKNRPLRRKSEDRAMKRGVFDVKKSEATSRIGRIWEEAFGGRVINLRPKLRARHPAVVFAVAAALVTLLTLSTRQALTRAEVADFFPAACLGDWDNPHLAQGKPESFGDKTVTPDESNSAIYDSSKAVPLRIFCGKFVPDDFETKGEIKNIGLTLVWQVGEKQEVTTNDTRNTTEEVTINDIHNATEDADGVTAETDSAVILNDSEGSTADSPVMPQNDTGSVPAEPEPAEPPAVEEEQIEPTSGFFRNIFGLFGFNSVAAQTNSGQTGLPQGEIATTGDSHNTTNEISAESLPAGEPGSAEEPPAEPAPSTVILNDSEGSDAEVEEIIITAPPIEARLEPVVTTTDDEHNTTNDIRNTTEEITTDDIHNTTNETSTGSPPPPPPDENFIKINFSTNGNDWFELGRINPKNWQNFTIPLPVKTWEELKNIQIRLDGMETSLAETPKVYLDGMFAEVHYELVTAAAVVGGDGDKTEGGEAARSTSPSAARVSSEPQPNSSGPSGSGQAGSPRAEIKIYDEGAAHKCGIEPFSQTVKAGGSAVFNVSLLPSFENSYFELITGDLPGGIVAVFDPPRGVGISTPRLTLEVAEGVAASSFDVIVVYREIDDKLDATANFCQLNLIVN